MYENEYGVMYGARIPAPKMITRPNNPSIARRWRKKRIRAYDHWLLTLRSRPAWRVPSTPGSPSPSIIVPSTAPATAWSGAIISPSNPCVVGKSSPESCLTSVITDPWVEEAVQDVRDQVEHDDRDRRDQEIVHHRVQIQLLQAQEEEVADPVEREDGLGDDRAAEQCAEVDRGDRRDRDQRVAEDVLHDHLPLRHALGAGGADIVAVDHVQHRGAHVAAVDREADGGQGDDR